MWKGCSASQSRRVYLIIIIIIIITTQAVHFSEAVGVAFHRWGKEQKSQK